MAKAAKPRTSKAPAASTRARIDHAAYALFSKRGIRGVGIDEVVAKSGVAKMTLYRHYPSKNELALSFLRRREELWTHAWLLRDVQQRSADPAEQLLAIFDVFNKWFRRADFEGCAFVNVLLESGPRDKAVRTAAIAHLAKIRNFVRELAEKAGVPDPIGLAHQWHILMKGSIVAAAEGDRDAARRASEVGRLLLSARLETAARDGGKHAAHRALPGRRRSRAAAHWRGPSPRST